MKPFSESCEQNKDVILKVIKPLLTERHSVFEIGSGTGQHAVYFAQHMPHLQWYTSDRSDAVQGIQLWIDEAVANAGLDNIHSPVTLDVTQVNWPDCKIDVVYSANTLHIMHWEDVKAFFKKAPLLLNDNGIIIIYGPFNYQGQYTSVSNERFDQWLRQRDPQSGIRDFTDLNTLAAANGLSFVNDYEMPANNRILVWKKAL